MSPLALARPSLRQYWVPLAILVGIFAVALFIRSYFAFDLATRNGFLVSGGSDSYYHKRIIDRAVETGEYLAFDPLLNYPLGFRNPRAPVYTWSTVLLGYLAAPFVGFNTNAGVWWSFEFGTALWGALTVFPTYLLAREAFGRRTGYVAALFLAIMPAHIQRSPFSDADHDSMVLFFVVLAFYFFLRGLRTLNERAYVTHWRTFVTDPRTFLGEMGTFLRENRRSLLYAALAGISLETVALIWQGWPYALVIIMGYLLVQLLVQRFRNQDPMGPVAVFAVTGGLTLLLAAPYYVGLGFYRAWYDTPLFLFLGTLLVGIAFTVTRRYPWVLAVPAILVAFLAALLVAGQLVYGSALNALLSGFGFFPRTKIYETIAEAQPPGVSTAILSFGPVTYYLSLAGVAWMIWQFPRRAVPDYLFVVVWTAASIFMAMTQARFIFNAAPAFAVPAAWIAVLLVERLGFGKIGEALRGGRGRLRALREGIKLRHVAGALFIAFLLVLPNTWLAVDAGVPFQRKQQLDQEVANALPAPLRPGGYRAGQLFYFGAFGFSLPLPNQYFPQAWRWFRSQDADVLPVEARPAYLSWWDYGFEVVQEGQHPTVADNFQNGIPTAGNFIAAQDEATAIAILALRVVDGDFAVVNHGRGFSPGVTAALAAAGLNPDEFLDAYRNPGGRIGVVLGDPARFGPYDSRMAPENAKIIYLSTVMREKLSADAAAELYGRLMEATGYQIRYFSIDSRLIPFSASNTGIFYAPIKLSDHRIVEAPNGQVIPIDFFRLRATLATGEQKDYTELAPTDRVQSVSIEYQPMFYRSMLYRTFFGLAPADIGSTANGLPGLPGDLQGVTPQQGWMLAHFRLVYKTAYFNPYPPNQVQNHTDAWAAMNYEDAVALQQNISAGRANGTVDLSPASGLENGIVFLKYYEGAVLRGRVVTADGMPVPGARVTVQDDFGIPHYVATTAADGGYEVLLPFGQPKVIVSAGPPNNQTQVGASTLAQASFSISDAQAMRRADNSTIVHDFVLEGQAFTGRLFLDGNRNGRLDGGEPGLGGANLILAGSLNVTATATASPQGAFAFRSLLPGLYSVTLRYQGRNLTGGGVNILPGQARQQDLNITPAAVQGRVAYGDGTPAPGVVVTLVDGTTGQASTAAADAAGSYAFGGLLPGPYTLRANAGGFTTGDVALTVAQGSTATQDLTLLPRGTVRGSVSAAGASVANAAVTFTARPPDLLQVVVRSDPSGAYGATLPAGTYDVYALAYGDGRPQAFLGSVAVPPGGTATLDLPLVPAVTLSGLAYQGNASAPAGGTPILLLLNGGGRYTMTTTANGTFQALLPPGAYTAVGRRDRWGLLQGFTLGASARHDFAFSQGTLVTGALFRDVNGNGAVDGGEGIPRAEATITTDGGASFPAYTDGTGSLPVVLLNGSRYGLAVHLPGFAPRDVPPTLDAAGFANASRVALVADKVHMTGRVTVEGAAPNGALTVRFEGLGRGAVNGTALTDPSGAYAVDLDPGVYRLAVDEPLAPDNSSRAQAAPGEQIALRVGQGSATRDLDLIRRWRVGGRVTLGGVPGAARLTFAGPEAPTVQADALGNYSLYLRAGRYNVTADGRDAQGREYALLTALDVAAPTTFDPALDPAVRVSGGLLAGGRSLGAGIPMNFTRAGGGRMAVNSTASGYAVFLPPGNYTVAIDYRTTDGLDGPPRYVRYTAQAPVAVPPGGALALDIPVTRVLDNRTLEGTVLSIPRGNIPVGATLSFKATTNSAIDATAATASGPYAVALAPGGYDLYAVANDGSAVFLGPAVVDPIGVNRLDIFLGGGHRLRGTATIPPGIGTAATLTVAGNGTAVVPTAADGSFSLLLPPGRYGLTAEARVPERGTPIPYRGTANVTLAADTAQDIAMARVTAHGVALRWTGTKVTVRPGEVFSTQVVVENRGSVVDTFDLRGTPSDWNFTFSPASVTLDFATGANSTTAAVTVQAPGNAIVEHAPVEVVATSRADAATSGAATLDVAVEQTRGVAVAPARLPATFNVTVLEVPVEVRNTGNGLDRFAVSLGNPEELRAAGWNATLVDPAQGISAALLHNVSIAARGMANVTLRLTALGSPRPADAVVVAAPEGTLGGEATAIVPVRLPELSSPGVRVEGPNASTTPEFPWFLVGLITSGAVLATGVALILVRRRRPPRGRRRR